jgi:hypothetical protein
MKNKKKYSGTIYVNTEVEVEPYDVIDELSDDVLIDELKSRGYIIKDEFDNKYDNKYYFKRNICDMFDLNYHTSNDDLITKIKENLY